MRYRALDADGDMTFGGGAAGVLVDSPAAVGQAVLTRLRLLKGEWFLDLSEGMPYATDVLGMNTGSTRDQAVRARILGTQGVSEIVSYSSSVIDRRFSVEVTISTTYGETTVQAVL